MSDSPLLLLLWATLRRHTWERGWIYLFLLNLTLTDSLTSQLTSTALRWNDKAGLLLTEERFPWTKMGTCTLSHHLHPPSEKVPKTNHLLRWSKRVWINGSASLHTCKNKSGMRGSTHPTLEPEPPNHLWIFRTLHPGGEHLTSFWDGHLFAVYGVSSCGDGLYCKDEFSQQGLLQKSLLHHSP